jgi:hypothetical protein
MGRYDPLGDWLAGQTRDGEVIMSFTDVAGDYRRPPSCLGAKASSLVGQ